MGGDIGVNELESPPVADGFEQTSSPVKMTPVTSSFSSIVNKGSAVPNEPKDEGILGGLYFLIGGLYFRGPNLQRCRLILYNDKVVYFEGS